MIVLAMAQMVGSALGCNQNEIGVAYGRDGQHLFAYSVKSKNTKFNVDSVAVDFYYGHHGGFPGQFQDLSNPDNYEFICFALYLFEGQYWEPEFSSYPGENVYADYYDINNRYFIKEISYDEFTSDEYAAKYDVLFGSTYNHHETNTVPSGVFVRESGSFVFCVSGVYFSIKDAGFCLTNIQYTGFISVNYDYLGEQTILLSKPSGGIPR